MATSFILLANILDWRRHQRVLFVASCCQPKRSKHHFIKKIDCFHQYYKAFYDTTSTLIVKLITSSTPWHIVVIVKKLNDVEECDDAIS